MATGQNRKREVFAPRFFIRHCERSEAISFFRLLRRFSPLNDEKCLRSFVLCPERTKYIALGKTRRTNETNPQIKTPTG